MSNRPVVATRPLTRAKLAEVLGQRPEQIRAFEAMFSDVNGVIPDAVEAAADSAAAAQVAAEAASVDASSALSATAALAASVAALNAALLAMRLPVGSIHVTVDPTNPTTTLGYGTWAAFGTGRVIVGVDVGDPDFDTVEETGGSKTATIS